MRFGGHIVVLLKTTSILIMSVLIPPPPIPIRVNDRNSCSPTSDRVLEDDIFPRFAIFGRQDGTDYR